MGSIVTLVETTIDRKRTSRGRNRLVRRKQVRKKVWKVCKTVLFFQIEVENGFGKFWSWYYSTHGVVIKTQNRNGRVVLVYRISTGELSLMGSCRYTVKSTSYPFWSKFINPNLAYLFFSARLSALQNTKNKTNLALKIHWMFCAQFCLIFSARLRAL